AGETVRIAGSDPADAVGGLRAKREALNAQAR
ncbi:MAG: hypothetical protein QOH97_206, partial [Actinoplanes sp.]|nr:hypothetical protein [Actinoplanes sp.]